jgi:PPOX class probable F420-dependent enzyme
MGDPDLTVERVLSQELREWILAELRYAVLAINSSDGAPSQSVMWFDLHPDEPDVLLMNTKVERLKYRQLQRDPRVSVLFENGLDWTALRGSVTLDTTSQPALEHIQALARRYGSDPSRFEGQDRVIIRVKVDKVIRHD